MSMCLTLKLARPTVLAAIVAVVAGCGSSASQRPLADEDEQFAQSSSTAMTAFVNGDVTSAVQQYQRALRRGHAMDDSRLIAEAAYDLAACEVELNQYDAASDHLQEAKYYRAREGAGVEEILLLKAKLAYLRERDSDAQAVAEPLCKSDLPVVRLQAQTLLILIACDLGNTADARSKLAALKETAVNVPNTTPAVKADIEKAEGMVAKLDRQMHAAAEHFDRETDLLRSAHRYRDLIHSLSRSGSAHDDAGEFAAAADRYYRAALGCSALDDQKRARELAQKALVAAKAAGNQELTSMIEHLPGETSATTAP